jgi:hypothetical protein
MTIVSARGREISHPAFRVLLAAERFTLSLLKEFQMTPMSRLRHGIIGDAEQVSDEEREFLKYLDGPNKSGDGNE